MSMKISVLFNKKLTSQYVCRLIIDLIEYNFQPHKCPSVHLH